MTKDEALKIAWDALSYINEGANNQGPHTGISWRCAANKSTEALNAIKFALEAKDEPVAWRDAAIRLGEELSSVGPDGYYDTDAKEWLDWAMEQNPRGKHSLPQRTWVGLTDEHKEGLICMTDPNPEPHHLRELIDVVEFQLKEKNS